VEISPIELDFKPIFSVKGMRLLGWWTFFKVVFVLTLCLVVTLAEVDVPLIGRKQFSILLSSLAGGKYLHLKVIVAYLFLE
jgi:hypothetical protein